jgi:ankyrin repeat protein
VNPADGRGDTPLHRAAYAGEKEIARMLVKAGAPRDVRNGEGLTPADAAAGLPGRLRAQMRRLLRPGRRR